MMNIARAFDGLVSESLGLVGLADHGTEVDTSQSDRLMMTNAGNTTSITQRAVPPSVTGQTQFEKFRSALDIPMSKETVAEKGYVVHMSDWTTSQVEGSLLAELQFPQVLYDRNYAIFGLLNYHEYLRASVDVLVQINPTEWQIGGLVAWLEPCQDTSERKYTNFNNIATYPSGFLNCNVNNEVRIKIPYVFSRNQFTLHQESTQPESLADLRIAVWNRLKVATGTSTVVSMKVTASLRDVEMHGIRIGAQMMRSINGNAASPAIQIDHGQGALNTSNHLEMRINAHMALAAESFESDATMAGGTEAKDLSLHLKTPCRFAEVSWTTTMTSGTKLAQWKVHPRQPANSYTTWAGGKCSTNIALLSSLYRYWRGDLVFTFQVFATKWHSGRLMAVFIPGPTSTVTSTTTLKQLSTCSAVEYDIHGPQSTFTFRVPWISALQYLDCNPANGHTGYLYLYVYNQLAAPNNVSSEVGIVCNLSGADNFELFVPSYNEVQTGPETPVPKSKSVTSDSQTAKEVADVQKVPVKVEKTANVKPRVYSESPMGAMEVPSYDAAKSGVFPELQDGRVLHGSSHTNLMNFLGRAHHWVSFRYSTAQSFVHDQPLNWSTISGTLGALARCFTLYRGGIKVVVRIETRFGGNYYVAFRPSGIETITTFEQLSKYGVVSFTTEQTNQVVLKLPWYQPLAANSIWSHTDGNFGYLTIGGDISGITMVHLSLAFDIDSHFYFPRGCPADFVWKPGTKNAVMHFSGAGPDHVSTETTEPSEIGDVETWSDDGSFPEVITLPHNLQAVPDKTVSWLCRAPDTDWPVDHYFLELPDGSFWGFHPVSGFYGQGEVRREEHDVYERIFPAAETAELVPLLEGPYEIRYDIIKFNCEHFARGFAGLPQISTQVNKIKKWLAIGCVAMAACPMLAQGTPETEEDDSNIPPLEECSKCSETECVCVKPEITPAEELSEDEEEEEDDTPSSPTCNVCKCKTCECVESEVESFGERFKRWIKPKTVKKKESPKAKSTDTKKDLTQFQKLLFKKTEPVVNELTEKASDKAFKNFTEWFNKTLVPTLTSRGAKIARKVTNIVVDLAQAACLIYLVCEYPVPGVVGPIVGFSVLGVARGLMNVIMRVRGIGTCDQKPEGLDEEPDFSEDVGSLVFEAVARALPDDMVPQSAQGQYMKIIRETALHTNMIRNVVVLGKWIVEACKKAIDCLLPGESQASAQALDDASGTITNVLALVQHIKTDPNKLNDGEMQELAEVTLHCWWLAQRAGKVAKDRYLCSKLDSAYATVREIMATRKLRGDGLPRVEPVVVWFHGAKGSGKTAASMALAGLICRRMNWDAKTSIYSKPVSAKYYDGYEQQPIMIMDDVGQNSGPNGNDFDDFCQLVSTAPLRLNMASINEKGIQFKTPIIIASSNIADPKPNGITDTSAIERRIRKHRFLVVPDPNYAIKVGSTSLNSRGEVDLYKANNDGKMRNMECVEFHPGIILGNKHVTLDVVYKGLMRSWEQKKQVHKSILETWFDFNPQAAADNTNAKISLKLLEKLGVKPPPPIKVIPKWMKVLLALSLALGLAALVAGAASLIWTVVDKTKHANKKQGAYNVNPTKPNTMLVPRTPVAMEQSCGDVVQLLRGHILPLGYRKGETIHYKVQGIAVRGYQILAPKHFVTMMHHNNLVLTSRDVEYEYEVDQYTIQDLKWAGQQTDSVIITLTKGGMQPYKDITSHFVRAGDVPSIDGTSGILVTNGRMGPTIVAESGLKFYETTTYGVEQVYNPAGVIIANACTYEGMCGGGLVSALNRLQNAVLGIHVAGNGDKATTQVVTREMFDTVPQMNRIVSVTEGPVIGTNTKTTFSLSSLAPYFNSGKIPAALSPLAKTDEDIFAVAMKKYSPPLRDAPNDWREYASEFKDWAISEFGSTTGGLTMSEAINGVDNLDGVNMKTSAGMPWTLMGMRKTDLTEWVGDHWAAKPLLYDAVQTHIDEVEENLQFDDWEHCGKACDKMCSHEFIHTKVQYITYYKDELRPREKVQSGNTRIIEAAPFHHVVGFRMRFGKGMQLLHKLPISTGFAPGCDIEKEARYVWGKARDALEIYDADYKNYDGSLQPFVLYSAFDVLGALCGVDPLTTRAWARTLVDSEHLFAGLRIRVHGGMPSGSPATTIINTLANLMMTYYAMYHLNSNPLSIVFQHHKVFAYGDDLIVTCHDVSIKTKTQAWVDKMWDVFGATLTDASKSAVPQPKTPLDVVFLQRVFIPDDETPWMVHAALNKTSIEAMVEYQRTNEAYADRLRAAIEAAFQWGPEFYGHFAARLGAVAHKAGARIHFPSYPNMRREWMRRMISS